MGRERSIDWATGQQAGRSGVDLARRGRGVGTHQHEVVRVERRALEAEKLHEEAAREQHAKQERRRARRGKQPAQLRARRGGHA